MVSRKRLGLGLYYTAFSIYLIISLVSYSDATPEIFLGTADNLVKLLCGFMILIKLFIERRYAVRHLAILALTGAMAIFALYRMQNAALVLMILLFVGAYGCSAKTIAKIYLIVGGGITGIIMVASLLGIVENRAFINSLGQARYCFGMGYPTTFASIVFFAFASYYFINNRPAARNVILAVIGGCFVYFACRARLETICFFLMAIMIPIYQKCMMRPLIKRVCENSFLLCILISYGMVFLYMGFSKRFQWLNMILSGRFSETAKVIQTQRFTMFGSNFRMQGWGAGDQYDWKFGYYYVDSAYIQYTLFYGVFFLIFFSIFVTCLMRILYHYNNARLILILISVAIHGIAIPGIYDMFVCPFFVIGIAQMSQEIALKKGVKQQYKFWSKEMRLLRLEK